IHSTKEVEVSLETSEGQRIQLHFLPPYCPDHNKIERVWRDLHDNVTRNHQCRDMKSLMYDVRYWIRKRNRNVLKTLAV
ncbi:MAG: transposase, partial [Planctomycetota bacterium]|nr:transposase [Planctomycetota bacterium]